VAGALVVTPASPAFAGVEDCNMKSYVSMTGAAACFAPYGDHWWVDDTKSDGHGVWLHFQTSYDRVDSCYVGAGNAAGWVDCNFDVKENTTIRGYVEVNDGSGNWSGWGGWVSTS